MVMVGTGDYPRQAALENPELFATVANAILLEKYGEVIYGWEPLTIVLEVKDDFGIDISDEVLDKFCAIQIVMSSDAFFTRIDAFLNICNTLASGSPMFSAFDKVTTEEAAWAITEVAINREMLPFSYAIKRYLRTVLAEDGFEPDEWPAVFDEVFSTKPKAKAIRETAAGENENNIDEYIDGELRAMFAQFDGIPGLRRIEDMIMERGVDEATLAKGKQ